MCPGALHPGALSISNRIKSFNIIKGRGPPIWITLFLHAFAHYICPDHLITHRITLGSRTDHASDHASDQVLCFLSKATADHIPGSLLYANGVNGEDLATLTEEILVKELRMTPFAARKVLRARHFGLGCDK